MFDTDVKRLIAAQITITVIGFLIVFWLVTD